MIVLHRKKNDPASKSLEEKLLSLVVSFETENHSESGVEHDLPYIEESDTVISGEQNIKRWLQELESELNWQRSISGDGCYVHPESGDIC